MHVFRDTTVHTHDLLVDQGYQGHVIKAIPECLPKSNLVSSLDLIEKSVDSGDGLRLVVASQNNDLSWVSHLKGEKKTDDLATLLATVHVVSHEQVAGRFRDDLITLLFALILFRHLLEHVEKIRVLPMDIAKNLYGCLELV